MPKSTFPQASNDFSKSNGSNTVFNTEGPSLTRQEFVAECDINSLMARYETHVIGGPGNLPPAVPMYADFASVPKTLLEYMDFMGEAEAAFMSLPAVVRKEFDNSAHLFVDFASDPANLEQMRTWGLAPPAKAPEKAEPGAGASGSPVGGGAPAAPPTASTQSST